LKAFEQLESYRSSTYSRLGLFYQGNSYIALNDPPKAATALAEYLRREKREPLLRQLGFLSLGYVHEKAGKHREAARSFAEAEKLPGPLKEEALLAKARSSTQSGDLKDALTSYQEFLKKFPASERAAEISLRIQELEAKLVVKK